MNQGRSCAHPAPPPPPAIFTNTGDLVISHLTNNLPCRNVLGGFVRNRGRSTPIPSISPPQPRTAHPSLNLMNNYSKQIAGTWRHCSSARILTLSLSMKRLRAMQSPCCRLVMICFIISAKSFPHVVPFSSRIFLSHIWQNGVQEVLWGKVRCAHVLILFITSMRFLMLA